MSITLLLSLVTSAVLARAPHQPIGAPARNDPTLTPSVFPHSRGPQPILVALSPDAVPAGAPAAVITLKGRGLTGPFSVSVQDCTGATLALAVPDPKQPVVRLPPAMLARPCVLRIAVARVTHSLPLAVADPELFTLAVPTPDPNEVHPWGGEVNTFCELDSTTPPPHHTLVAIVSDSVIPQHFVLGKNNHVLLRLATIPSHASPSTGHCLYVALPGIEDDDVRWGPKDVENFWVATLSEDGTTVHDVQFLADMVREPSGPVDQN